MGNRRVWWAFTLGTTDEQATRLFYSKFGYKPLKIERDAITRCLMKEGKNGRHTTKSIRKR